MNNNIRSCPIDGGISFQHINEANPYHVGTFLCQLETDNLE
jgi:hypothetical protein